MRINTQYIEHLNDFIMWNKKNKNTVDTSNLEVLQIGVGGFTSCGKTLLYDAMLSLFGDLTTPYYLPLRFKQQKGKISPVTTSVKYLNYQDIQKKVRDKIEQKDIKTPLEDGTWSLNTYEGILNFCGIQKKIIIRDIPGEIFKYYYTPDEGINRVSFHTLFERFCGQKGYNKDTYKDFFKINQENKIKQIREDFFDYLKTSDSNILTSKNTQYENFFAYFFFKSSDVNIFCLSLNKTDEDQASRKAADDYILSSVNSNPDNVVLCFTQFDRVIDRVKFLEADYNPQYNDNQNIINESYKGRFKNKEIRKIISKVKNILEDNNESFPQNNSEPDLDIYWSQMTKLYEDTLKDENDLTVISKKENWRMVVNQIGGKDNLKQIPYFLTSTAYHNSKKCFVDYEGDTTAWSVDYSSENYINLRRSMGILEMMLHILKKNGFDLNKSSISHSKYRTIGNKIG